MQLQVHHERPRDLKWFHAAGMLFGDWGTSRLYVLGLAFFYSGMAAPLHVGAMCVLLAAVAWAYTIICRCFTDGGGVYSSAKHTHPQLALLGAYLLFADYVITASLSAVEAFRYFGASTSVAPVLAIFAVVGVGVVNFVGPRRAGRLAAIVALAMGCVTVTIALFCIPKLNFQHLSWDHRPLGVQWSSFVHIILALSGVEAIANMTGVMAQPVSQTSRKAIWIVLAEVIFFNLLFAVVMTALPGMPSGLLADTPNSALTHHDLELRDTMVKYIAAQVVHPYFAIFASAVFGLLLLSAANTAVADMVNVQYAMARDGEMPRGFLRLNIFGVPWLGLVTAVAACTIVLLFEGDVEKLAHLYAIGVVGAITINLASTCTNMQLSIKRWERNCMGALAILLFIVECTIALQKLHATVFVLVVISGGYLMRAIVRRAPSMAPHIPRVTSAMARWFEAPPLPESADALSMVGITPFDPGLKKTMVSTRGNLDLVTFAAEEAEARKTNLIVLFVRDVHLSYGVARDEAITPREDAEALAVFKFANQIAREKEVPYLPIYCVAGSIAETILDFAGTYGVDFLIVGASRRGSLLRAIRGDVISEVAAHLPKETKLLIYA